MDGLTVEHSLFELLRQEHKGILTRLERLNSIAVTREDVQGLWDHIEVAHHEREERILFNALVNNPQINGGGPLCMIYMDHYIMEPPLDQAKALTGRLPLLEVHQQQIFDEGSAMRIPVNEHRAGKEILRHLLVEWENLSEAKILACIRGYRTLQAENIHKEENCFYYMCASLLTPNEANLLLSDYKL